MIKLILFSIIISLLSKNSLGHENKDSGVNFDTYVYDVEWVGNEVVFNELKNNKIDRCSFLKEKSKQYQDSGFVIRKIFNLYRDTKCPERLGIVKEHLAYNNKLNVKISALRLANMLNKKEKLELVDLVKKLDSKTRNRSDAQTEIKIFNNSIKKN